MLSKIEPTKKYFFAMFVVSCVLLILFTSVIYKESQDNDINNALVIHNYEILRQARLILTNELNIETGQRGFLLTGLDKFLEPYNAAIKEIDTEIKDLKDLTVNNAAQQNNIKALSNAIEVHKALLASNREKYLHSKDKNLIILDLEASKNAMDKVRDHVNTIVAVERELLNEHFKAAQKQHGNYIFVLLMGSVLGLGALMIANFVIYTLLVGNRKTENELRESEEIFSLVVNGINDGIYDYDERNNKIFYSKAYKEMLGYTNEEFPNTLDSFNKSLHPDDVEKTWKTFEKYSKHEVSSYYNEYRMRHKKGNWVWIMSRGVGQWDSQGKMFRLIGAHTNITLHKEREEELRQLNSDMEGFTYIASHDLRAPLVNLKGFAGELNYAIGEIWEIIKHKFDLFLPNEKRILEQSLMKDMQESLSYINSAVERMDKLTTAILDMSRIGRREYRIEATNPNVIVQRCLNTLAHEIAKRGITIESAELPNIRTDPLALEQIFGNILDNAIKYLDPLRPGKIKIDAILELGNIKFSVADNGRGIADIDHNKVFEIFRRAGNIGDVRGVGMGMAFVKATIRKLNGKIWLESETGKGTIFYFTLPHDDKESL